MSRKYNERVLYGSGVSAKRFHSTLGESILSKFGWKDGDGLGKNMDGKKEPLQIPKRKGLLGVSCSRYPISKSYIVKYISDTDF